MNIAILGTGNVGQALGAGWAARGYKVVYGSRDPLGEKTHAVVEDVGNGVTAVAHQQAVDGADVVVLAMPWAAVEPLLTTLSGWDGKILVDATNPIAPGLQLAVGKDSSAAELIAGWAPGARVVKAFNTTGANNMADPVYRDESTTMFIAGDDAVAKTAVTQLAQDLGFDVADVGDLTTARFLEPLALVWISLARQLGRDIAFKLVRRG